jgi:hypothetical protein
MSFTIVKDLRKSGKLDEALLLANQDLDNNPEELWNKRSAGWVFHDYLRKFASDKNYPSFLEYLNKLISLELPAGENMIFDFCTTQISRMIFFLSSETNIDYNKIDKLFKFVKLFHLSKPSETYSFLFKALHKAFKNHDDYLSMADWWDFSHFRQEDYQPEVFQDRKIMSLAEQAYIAYAKSLLEGESSDFGVAFSPKTINKNKIRAFLPQLDKIIEEHPEFLYLSYFKAKLLLALGHKENVLSSFIPFAKRKDNHFWVWELMSDVFPSDDEKKIACLCKALSLNTPDTFLVKTRQKLAELLVNEKKYKEAKTEISLIAKTRNENNWKIPEKILQWEASDWFLNTEQNKDNHAFYMTMSPLAVEILFEDIPEETIVVEFVNKDKQILNFVKDKSKHGFFQYSGLCRDPEAGDVLSVRFISGENQGFFKIGSAKKLNADSSCGAINTFEGKVKIIEPMNFGFVNDVFIHPSMIKEENILPGQQLTGKSHFII